MKRLLTLPIFYKPADLLFSLFTLIGSVWLRIAKFIGLSKLPITRNILFKIGVFPIVDHYYEPLYRFDKLEDIEKPRKLRLEWNDEYQLQFLKQLSFKSELQQLLIEKSSSSPLDYYFNNGSYSGIDAEYLYSFVRAVKPKRIIEIGSGFSTRLIIAANKMNEKEPGGYPSHITCIEPYEMNWLEQTGAQVIRHKVEDVPLDLFMSLEVNDLLFIDSSHVIRPQGDVLYELFTILPILKPGVFIHIHDIFSPFDYPKKWMTEEYRMWNEQYLLEAFLMHNNQYNIIGALAYMGYKYPDLYPEIFPISKEKGYTKGSAMWIRKN